MPGPRVPRRRPGGDIGVDDQWQSTHATEVVHDRGHGVVTDRVEAVDAGRVLVGPGDHRLRAEALEDERERDAPDLEYRRRLSEGGFEEHSATGHGQPQRSSRRPPGLAAWRRRAPRSRPRSPRSCRLSSSPAVRCPSRRRRRGRAAAAVARRRRRGRATGHARRGVRLHLLRAHLLGDSRENAVDVAARVLRRVPLRKLDRLVQHHCYRHAGLVHELVHRDPEHTAVDRRHPPYGPARSVASQQAVRLVGPSFGAGDELGRVCLGSHRQQSQELGRAQILRLGFVEQLERPLT